MQAAQTTAPSAARVATPAPTQREPARSRPFGEAFEGDERGLGFARRLRPSTAGGRPLQRKCACGGSAGLSGSCEECGRKRMLGLQRKVEVGAADDAYEREADRVADAVVAGAVTPAPRAIRRIAAQPAAGAEQAPASVDAVLASTGRPLEPSLRSDMELGFGHDFSRVRVHADAAAEQSARDLDARAYTLGHDIVFGAGRYAPHTTEGRRLLAHELTHVVQQSQAAQAPAQRVQRGSLKGPTTKPHSCGGWTCAPMSDCKKPDDKGAPTSTPSTSWKLTANLDVDVLSASEITGPSEVGHAFVEFTESNGDRYTYGHYPNKTQSPDPVLHPQVPGCTAHPDQTHSACVDMRIPFMLTQAEYTAALGMAQAWCSAGQPYNVLTNNCATFVSFVVGAAGKTLPGARGSIGYGSFSADNPNTLFEAYIGQTDSAAWRQRVTGSFTGHYDTAGGASVTFSSFKLKTDDKYSVAGKYSYTGSSGDKVEGTLDGSLTFEVDPATKAVIATVKFDWSEPSGTGKGVWNVSASGDLKGTWGRGAADSGAGAWELTKLP
jgi:hypothetical protein